VPAARPEYPWITNEGNLREQQPIYISTKSKVISHVSEITKSNQKPFVQPYNFFLEIHDLVYVFFFSRLLALLALKWPNTHTR
jgi:hypothetical protein